MPKYINLKLVQVFASFYAIDIILRFIKRIYLDQYYTVFNVIYISILDWLVVVSFMIVIAVAVKWMYEKKVKLIYALLFHFILSFALGAVFMFFAGILQSIFIKTGWIIEDHFTNFRSFNLYMLFIDKNYVTYFVMLGIILIYHYINHIKEVEADKTDLAIQLTTTKMKVLKSQLQPHFLFNTMNSIQSLMDEDIEKSKHMLVDLSDLLRVLIDHKDENLIDLKDEMILVNKYLDILKIRFYDDFQVKVNIAHNLESALIPSMLLQPIIENSIKHGYSNKNTELSLVLSVLQEADNIIILVKNNGKFLDKPMKELINNGSGIKNTIERLKTLYKDNFKYKMYNSELGVTTKILIPFNSSVKSKLI